MVSVEEIGALFLETGAALEDSLTAMTSIVVVGFEAVDAHVTGPEKTRETGDDIVTVVLMGQEQLFGLVGAKLFMWHPRSASTKMIWYS